MLFSSLSFLYIFLPLTLAAYYIVPARLRNGVLFLASLCFYFLGEPKYALLLLFSCAASYGFALLIERTRTAPARKALLVCSVATALLLLGFFKYTDFVIGTINGVFGSKLTPLRLALPIGISFYTFQALSYTVDVYRGHVRAQRSFIAYGAYLTMFPQLIAGPIVRYEDIEHSLMSRTLSFEGFYTGVRRFSIGLGKKILLANTFGELTAMTGESALFYWMRSIAFCLQIYFDFAAYSDMAIGLGHMVGFKFPENFSYPYISRSITEFWRRWHMTLGSWFRDYLYIPMGGNRVGKARFILNIAVVWAATGLWHGASWNFVLWGLYFALLLLVEKLFLGKALSKAPVLGHIYTLFAVLISFVIFSGENLAEIGQTLSGMFSGKNPLYDVSSLYLLRSFALTFAIGISAATPLWSGLINKIRSTRRGDSIVNIAEIPFYLALIALCTAYLVDGSFNPFLYFRF